MRTIHRWTRPLLGLVVPAMLLGCAAHRTDALGDSPESRLLESERRAEALAAGHHALAEQLDEVKASLVAAEQARDLAQSEVRDRDAQIAALTQSHETELAERTYARDKALADDATLRRRLGALRSELSARDQEIERKQDLMTELSDNAAELRAALTASQERGRSLKIENARLADDLNFARLSGIAVTAVLAALLCVLAAAWAVQYRKFRRQAGRKPDLLHLHLPGVGGRDAA